MEQPTRAGKAQPWPCLNQHQRAKSHPSPKGWLSPVCAFSGSPVLSLSYAIDPFVVAQVFSRIHECLGAFTQFLVNTHGSDQAPAGSPSPEARWWFTVEEYLGQRTKRETSTIKSRNFKSELTFHNTGAAESMSSTSRSSASSNFRNGYSPTTGRNRSFRPDSSQHRSAPTPLCGWTEI